MTDVHRDALRVLDDLAGARSTRGAPQESTKDRDALIDALETHWWPTAAARLLATLGFRLVRVPRRAGACHLLVALRARPTLQHFDPERVEYFEPDAAGRGILRRLDRRTPPGQRRALWGRVEVIDRIPVENRFLTFGGRLRLVVIDPATTVLDFASPAPIVPCGGHSQGTELLAEAMGAFFGRLMVPVDFVPGAEQRLVSVDPAVLYQAFLAESAPLVAQARRRDPWPPAGPEATLDAAWRLARQDEPRCTEGRQLLRELGLSGQPTA